MDKFRDFARPPQVENLINAEAGLLTYPLPMPSQLFFEVLPRSQWQRFSAVITTPNDVAETQQRGLSGIFTRFPFHRNPQSRVVANLCYCKYRNFFVNKKREGRDFSTSPTLLLQLLSHSFGVLGKELIYLGVELFDVLWHLAWHLILCAIL